MTRVYPIDFSSASPGLSNGTTESVLTVRGGAPAAMQFTKWPSDEQPYEASRERRDCYEIAMGLLRD